MLTDSKGPGPFDDRFQLLSRLPLVTNLPLKWRVQLRKPTIVAAYARNQVYDQGRATHTEVCGNRNPCRIPTTVAGIGGLGMHGCEYGLHPDTFVSRREALWSFRRSVLDQLESLNEPAEKIEVEWNSENDIRVLLVQREDIRRFTNLEALVQTLNTTVLGHLPPQKAFHLDVKVVDFGSQTLFEQIREAAASKIMVAVDGTVSA